MKSLLNFLYKYNHLLLFVILEIFCFSLIVKYNNYQRVSYINSSNAISGLIFEKYTSIKNYFELQKINDNLAKENAKLRTQLISIKQSDIFLNSNLRIDSSIVKSIPAKVINNTINKQNNYITLNKGYKDGVRLDMGVISNEGIIGVVVNVSKNYSAVLSLLNERWSVNAKLFRTNHFGTLRWEGGNPYEAVLSEIPNHVEVNPEDTIVTSGFSTIFPEGIIIGKAIRVDFNPSDNFKKIVVQLFVDFSSLNYVEIIDGKTYSEKDDLEKLLENE